MRSAEIRKLIRTPLFRCGLAAQCLSAALLGFILLAIRLGWIDCLKIALETPLDERSPKLDALYWGERFLFFAFASGFLFYVLALHGLRKPQLGAPPNGGPETRLGNSGVTEGPPSVS